MPSGETPVQLGWSASETTRAMWAAIGVHRATTAIHRTENREYDHNHSGYECNSEQQIGIIACVVCEWEWGGCSLTALHE